MRTALSSLAFVVVVVASFGGVPRARAAPPEPPVVAALYFDYDGTDDELRQLKKGLASLLISDLTGVGTVRVVERDRLESVLAELKLQASPQIDRASAVKVGKLLGARFLVMGRFFHALGKFRVDARIVDVQTGQVLASLGETGTADDFLALEQKLAGGIAAQLAKLAPPAGAPAGTPAGTPRKAAAKPPAKLKAKAVAEYGRALEAIDRGDKPAAKKILQQVVTETPDFSLAKEDLDRLMK